MAGKSLPPIALFNNEQPQITMMQSTTTDVNKTSLQLLIDEMEDDIRVEAVELESARDHLSNMEKSLRILILKLN